MISIFFNHYNDKSKGFKVLDFKSMTQGDIITWYIDFEEQDPKWKSN